MITITLRLSESLLSIFRETKAPKQETCKIQIPSGTLVGALLADQGINPLLVPMVGWSTTEGNCKKQIQMNTPLDQDGVLTLYGPLAGG